MRNGGIAALCALVALVAGLWLGGHPESLPGPVRDTFVQEDRAMRAEIIDSIEDNFYKPVDEKKLDDASLKGIVESLDDPYSHYLTPKEAKQLNDSVSGQFEGVGMNVEQDKRGLKVLRVFDGAPAARRGHPPRRLHPRRERPLDRRREQRRGHQPHQGAGGDVGRRSAVFTPGQDRDRTVKVKRERIEIPVARGRMVERGRPQDRRRGAAQLQLRRPRSGPRARSTSCSTQGAEAIVLDLRGNGGGLLSEAVLVSSIFIEDGKIVSVRGRHRPERTQDAEGDAIDEKIPVVTLVDGGSASASEIVTGALRDRKRAKVVGTRTFGKGLVQEIQPLSNGGVLDITVANYYLPGGETISTKGIKPEIRAVDDPDTDRDEALPVAVDELLRELR